CARDKGGIAAIGPLNYGFDSW
nr:immunoglobulin heavy chain junction region [Macaca mulatta]MOX38305.1 immunoglobulin heavy chain junction region [Macaca mulatta]MOX38631.1 immunoglobulin heavy chain junction region [Macaca mulatta]MOX38961.1 immunoglobulin heavy chain junction region [Macaca mulatta]MOX39458.1 immunoglobulin heavy chain junction region [Macaca mulatta]